VHEEVREVTPRARQTIRSGERLRPGAAPDPGTPMTLGDVLDVYERRHVKAPTRRKTAAKPIGQVTKADIEAVRDSRRAELAERERSARRAGRWADSPAVRAQSAGGDVGINRLLAATARGQPAPPGPHHRRSIDGLPRR